MRCRCAVPLLVFHLLLRELSAFALPKAARARREMRLLDPDFPRWLPVEEVNPGDLSPGDDTWDPEGRRPHAGPVLLPHLDPPPTPRHGTLQRSPRKRQETWRRVAPMDSIGTSLMSGRRNRKDGPSDHWDEYSE